MDTGCRTCLRNFVVTKLTYFCGNKNAILIERCDFDFEIPWKQVVDRARTGVTLIRQYHGKEATVDEILAPGKYKWY